MTPIKRRLFTSKAQNRPKISSPRMCQSPFIKTTLTTTNTRVTQWGKMEIKREEVDVDTSEILLAQEPPYFKGLVKVIKMQLALCNKIRTIPFDWDDVSGGLCLIKNKRRLKTCLIQTILHAAYAAFMTIYFFTPNSMNDLKSSSKMVGLAFLVCFDATIFMRMIFWIRKKEAVHLINNFIKFESTYLPKPIPGAKTKADPITKMLMTLGFATSIGLPGLMCTMIFMNPCKPPHLGYILFRDGTEGCHIPHWSVRIPLLALDAWVWFNSIPAACFFGFQIFFPGLRALGFYIGLLRRLSKQPLGTSPHFKTIVARDYYCFKVYRHIQGLAKLYNFCMQMVFIPTQISAACAVLIIGLYTCIKLHSEIPMPGFAFFPLISMDGFAMIFISNVAAGVYTQSGRFVRNARKSQNYRRKTWFRKAARATSMIKIRFGSTNYIDKMTPLVYLNFCLNQTVQLVMLSE